MPILRYYSLMSPEHDKVAEFIQELNEGKEGAFERLSAAVYDELHAMAQRRMRRKFGRSLAGLTMQPTDAVQETFMRLMQQRCRYDNRGHFMAIASMCMLRVLNSYYRSRTAEKRGAGVTPVPLDDVPHPAAEEEAPPDDSGAALLAGLEKLERLDPRKTLIFVLREMYDFTIDEVADALSLGHATVERDVKFTRAWLTKEVSDESA